MAKRPPLFRSNGSYSTQFLPRPAPFCLKAFDSDRLPSYMNEKIALEPETWSMKRFSKRLSIKPDLDQQHYTTFKAPPKPRITPKRVMRKFRVSIVLFGALSIASFMSGLFVLLGGNIPFLENVFLFKLDTMEAGKNIIRFDTVPSATARAPTMTGSRSSPASPVDSSDPLSQLTESLEPVIDSLTKSLDGGLGSAIDQVVDGLINEARVKGKFTFYMNRVCERREESEMVGVAAEACLNYPDAVAALQRTVSNFPPSLVIGQTAISIPKITELSQSGGYVLSSLSTVRGALVVFLITSLISSGLIILLAVPSLLFRASRLLIFVNIVVANISSLFAFATALLLTVLVVGALSLAGNLGYALGLSVERGLLALTFLWVNSGLMALVGLYWGAVWFVEVRRWSFAMRLRTDEEVGNWRGMKKEIWRDIGRQKIQ